MTLGGGYGYLSPEHGLAIDNLVQVSDHATQAHMSVLIPFEATVVTADGSVLTASDTENSDLFFAIRGGGSNFGVVTEFVLKLHPQRATVYSGLLIFGAHSLEKFVEVTAEWWAKAGEKEGMVQMMSVGPDGNVRRIYHLLFNMAQLNLYLSRQSLYSLSIMVTKLREGKIIRLSST